MSDNIRQRRQDFDFGVEDSTIVLTSDISTQNVLDHRFSMIGVLLNPKKQDMSALLNQLPQDWGLSNTVVGRMVSPERFQFLFQSKEDLELVLLCGPASFSDWMLVTHKWSPVLADNNLKIIPFWIQIRGIPPQILSPSLLVKIGRTFGHVSSVDNNETNAQTGFARVQVHWNVDNPLRFQRVFRVNSGKRFLLKFHYENLRNFCTCCGMLTHDFGECPTAEPDDNCEIRDRQRNVTDGNFHALKPIVSGTTKDAHTCHVPSLDQDLAFETWRYMQLKMAQDRFHVEDFANLLFRYSNMYEYQSSPKQKRLQNTSAIPLDDGDALSSTDYSYSVRENNGSTFDNPIIITDDYSVAHNFDITEVKRTQDLRLAKGKYKPEDLAVATDISPNMGNLFHSSKKKSRKPRMSVIPQRLRIEDQQINTHNGESVGSSPPSV